MIRGNVIHYVTRQYMKKNKKRTLTTFLGIAFMVMLMTCVFVGKDTALGFLQDLASAENGKWHVAMYDLTDTDVKKLQSFPWVSETARSADLGTTDFAQSANEKRPYLTVKSYEKKEFDWMNIRLVQGRLPQSPDELVVSQSALDDGAKLAVGDTVEASFFQREVTALGKSGSVVFPFYSLEVKAGQTLPVPQNFPYYGSNQSFEETRAYTGQTMTYKVVGIIETPSYESAGSAGYTALTLYREQAGASFNLSMKLNLKEVPADYGQQLQTLAGNREITFNNTLLGLTGDSSNSTMNLMVDVFTVFFLVLIMAASLVLIYNVFNLSFQERSLYLGKLASVGATGRQKRSSVYYEALLLFLPALPLGMAAGMGIVQGGMALLKPYLVDFMVWGSHITDIPVKLQVSAASPGMTAAAGALTVLVSAFWPARRVGKIGAIDSIRGNTEKRQKTCRTSFRRGAKDTEGRLAFCFVKRQKRRTAGIRRAASVFLIVVSVTSFGADLISQTVEKKTENGSSYTIAGSGETGVLYADASSEGRKTYEAVMNEVENSPDTESLHEWEVAQLGLTVPDSVYSKEYWAAYHDIFNQYYHRTLSEEEFYGYVGETSFVSLLACDDATLREIADQTGTSWESLTDETQPGAIVLQSGHLSTDNIIANGDSPEHYRYYELQRMTDLKEGDSIDGSVYSAAKGETEPFSLRVASVISAEQASKWVSADEEHLWVLISSSTARKLEAAAEGGDGTSLFTPEAHITLKSKDCALMEQLRTFSDGSGNVMFLEDSAARLMTTIRDALTGMIRILLICFVLLTSLICLLNLYNSVNGYMTEQRREMTILASIGMTGRQKRRMLQKESFLLVLESLLSGAVCSAVLIALMQAGMTTLFGHLKFHLPLPWILAAILLMLGSVAWMMMHASRKIQAGLAGGIRVADLLSE